MANVSNSVVHLTMRFGSEELSIGTGVIYKRDNQHFIVTAWHNITGRNTETLKPLSGTCGVPDNVVANMAVRIPGMGVKRFPITIPLFDEEKALFYIHPKNYPRIDVVAIPFDLARPYSMEMRTFDGKVLELPAPLDAPVVGFNNLELRTELCPLQNFLLPREEVAQEWLGHVDVTEELFIPGYPQNLQDYYAQPVWKRATIASSVQSGWNGEPMFLVDSASKSGMSGSPVLYYSPRGEVRIGGNTYRYSGEISILAGIYVGRMGVTDKGDPQIGVVWHQSVINEIIDGRCHERLAGEIEASPAELKKAIQDELCERTRIGLAQIKNPQTSTRFVVAEEIYKRVEGRASRAAVMTELLASADSYAGPFFPVDDD